MKAKTSTSNRPEKNFYRIQAKYMDYIALDGGAKFLLMDLIELDEDLQTLSELIRKIVKCELDVNEIDAQLVHVGANLWHTIDHLKSMERAIRYIWNHPKQPKSKGHISKVRRSRGTAAKSNTRSLRRTKGRAEQRGQA